MVHRLPVRLRLTLWYTVLIALVMVVLGFVVFGSLRWRMNDAFDEQLQHQANLASSQVIVEAGEIYAVEFTDDSSLWDIEVIPAPVAEKSPDFDANLEPTIGAAEADAHEKALEGGSSFVEIASSSEGDVRAYVSPILDDNANVVGALQVSGSRATLNEASTELAETLAIVSPLMLILAAGAGYALAGRALRPVARITTLAANIGANDLHERLNLALPNDELGRLAHTFDAMLERMQDAFTRQKRFTGDAAHELRTPLTLMRSQIDLALAHPRTPAEYQEALHHLDTDLARITNMVETLLALARADHDQMTLEPSPFDLAETIASVTEMYQGTARTSGVALREACEPLTITADEDLVIQVLVNLVDNALAHTPEGGSVTIGCERETEFALIRLVDTGAGIPVEDQERVFDRFYRVASSAQPGAGLGLAICRAIVERHGGAIRLESSLGLGTTVEVRLPLIRTPPTTSSRAPHTSSRA